MSGPRSKEVDRMQRLDIDETWSSLPRSTAWRLSTNRNSRISARSVLPALVGADTSRLTPSSKQRRARHSACHTKMCVKPDERYASATASGTHAPISSGMWEAAAVLQEGVPPTASADSLRVLELGLAIALRPASRALTWDEARGSEALGSSGLGPVGRSNVVACVAVRGSFDCNATLLWRNPAKADWPAAAGLLSIVVSSCRMRT